MLKLRCICNLPSTEGECIFLYIIWIVTFSKVPRNDASSLLTQYRKFFSASLVKKASDVFYEGHICIDVATVKQSPTSAVCCINAPFFIIDMIKDCAYLSM